MRILVANDGFGDPGGVQQYLDACVGGLVARGHQIAMLHRDPDGGAKRVAAAIASLPRFSAAADLDAAIGAVHAWQPDVCYSHNMDRLDVDRRLASVAPIVKFMHGYFGTCVGGLKRHAFPTARPCDRAFGPACAALFFPRRCGGVSPADFVSQYRWASAQQSLFSTYRAIVVASGHMKREYVRNGADASAVHVNPLFPTCEPVRERAAAGDRPRVVFLGRMTALKGGDILIRAAARAATHLGASIAVTLVGDGPERPRWEELARALRVDAAFTGWRHDGERLEPIRTADLIAVPSTWPEPFGLAGLDAAALGVPAIAFDVGGIREWLRPGLTGVLVPGDPPRASAFGDALAAALADRARLTVMGQQALAVAREMSIAAHLDRLEPLLDACAGARSVRPELLAR